MATLSKLSAVILCGISLIWCSTVVGHGQSPAPSCPLIIGIESAPGAFQIQTYDFCIGGDPRQLFTPSGATEPGANGSGVEVIGAELFYTSNNFISGTDVVHVVPIGSTVDVRTFFNPRPTAGILALSQHDGDLYILTGFPEPAANIYKVNKSNGAILAGPLDVGVQLSSSDGFTVLPTGKFLINSSARSCTYQQYDPFTGSPIAGSTIVVPGGAGGNSPTSCGGVATDGTYLFFRADSSSCFCIIQTDLSGSFVSAVGLTSNIMADISVVSGSAPTPSPLSIAFDPEPKPNIHGWNNSDVSIYFTLFDSAPNATAISKQSSPLLVSTEGLSLTPAVDVSDNLSNSKSFPSPAISLDKTPPTVTIYTPTDGTTFPMNTTPTPTASYLCSDNLSGVPSTACVGSVGNNSAIDTSAGAVGVHRFSVTATDLADNTSTKTVTYSVTAPDLVETAVRPLITTVMPGGQVVAADTALNAGTAGAAASVTRYYLAPAKGGTRLVLSGSRAIGALAPAGTSSGVVAAMVPATIALGQYALVACADDGTTVAESNETNNCLSTDPIVQITLPDLVESAVTNSPPIVARGGSVRVTDTVLNQGGVVAAASTTRYYLSFSGQKDAAAVLLAGQRLVPSLLPVQQTPIGSFPVSSGAVTALVPLATPLGTYFLLACADDLAGVAETNETNNCRSSTNRVTVNR